MTTQWNKDSPLPEEYQVYLSGTTEGKDLMNTKAAPSGNKSGGHRTSGSGGYYHVTGKKWWHSDSKVYGVLEIPYQDWADTLNGVVQQGYKSGQWITIVKAGCYTDKHVGKTFQIEENCGPYKDGSFNYRVGEQLLSQVIENIRPATEEEIAQATGQSTEGWKVGEVIPVKWLMDQYTHNEKADGQPLKWKKSWDTCDRKVDRVEDGWAKLSSAGVQGWLPPKHLCTPLPTEWIPKVGDWIVWSESGDGKAYRLSKYNGPKDWAVHYSGGHSSYSEPFEVCKIRRATLEEIRKAEGKPDKQYICTSEDGVEMYDGDQGYWIELKENVWKYSTICAVCKSHMEKGCSLTTGKWKVFSTKAAAEAWIEQQNNPRIQGKKWRIGDWFKIGKCYQILRVEGTVVYVSTSTGGEVEYTIAEVDKLYGGTWIPIAAPGESSTNKSIINSQTKTTIYGNNKESAANNASAIKLSSVTRTIRRPIEGPAVAVRRQKQPKRVIRVA